MIYLSETIQQRLEQALAEDAPQGDITSRLTIPAGLLSTAYIKAKADGVFFGTEAIRFLSETVKPEITVDLQVFDGETVSPGDILARFHGSVASILFVERTLLNVIQRLSGIATITRQFVKAVEGTGVRILDTRKTTPLWRDLEKAAVVAGGGMNHRMNLSDMVLIKDNHLSGLRHQNRLMELGVIIRAFKADNPNIGVMVEIANLDQLSDWDLVGADYVMLDNFSPDQVRAAVAVIAQRQLAVEIEVSGNIRLDNIQRYALPGVHRISIGCLTHSVTALDLSLLFE